MSRRRIERDLDAAGETVLSDLDPEARFRVALQAEAMDRGHWDDRLRETCPRATHRLTDPAYVRRRRLAIVLRQDIVYDLHTTLLERALLRERQQTIRLSDRCHDDTLSADAFAQVRDQDDRLTHLGVRLYTQYHAADRFAQEQLGVALETWLGGHPVGEAVLTETAAVVDRLLEAGGPDALEHRMNLALGATDADADGWLDLEAQIDTQYDWLVEQWSQSLEN